MVSARRPLKESWVNPALKMPHLGYQGRLNGPVDNSISSCLSGHSTAGSPEGQMTPPNGADPASWSRNIPTGTAFDPGRIPLEYSPQLSVGLGSFNTAKAIQATRHPAKRRLMMKRFEAIDRLPPRDGGSTR